MKNLIHNIFQALVDYNYGWLAAPHRDYGDVAIYTLFGMVLTAVMVALVATAVYYWWLDRKLGPQPVTGEPKYDRHYQEASAKQLEETALFEQQLVQMQLEGELFCRFGGEKRSMRGEDGLYTVEHVGAHRCATWQEMFENLSRVS